MSIVFDHGQGRLAARLTPWDERALGFATAEVTALEIASVDQATALLAELEQWCAGQSVRYLFGRIDAMHAVAKAALLQQGYQFVETSLTVSRSGFANLPAVPRGMLPTLRPATAADVPELRRIAATDFAHGRFLEDPAIDPARAAQRTANWIEDLVSGGLAQVAESRGRTIGFHAERVDIAQRSAELLLTGATAPYAMLAVPLWITALEALAARDIQQCTTLVSAANTGIINLYARLGFHFNSTLFGFRKFL
ncbi:MAG: GNAT family N-acetyltransferase [Stenotrophomonas maltophilia]